MYLSLTFIEKDKKYGVITDENRLVGALPTIKYLVENGKIKAAKGHIIYLLLTLHMKYRLKS